MFPTARSMKYRSVILLQALHGCKALTHYGFSSYMITFLPTLKKKYKKIFDHKERTIKDIVTWECSQRGQREAVISKISLREKLTQRSSQSRCDSSQGKFYQLGSIFMFLRKYYYSKPNIIFSILITNRQCTYIGHILSLF